MVSLQKFFLKLSLRAAQERIKTGNRKMGFPLVKKDYSLPFLSTRKRTFVKFVEPDDRAALFSPALKKHARCITVLLVSLSFFSSLLLFLALSFACSCRCAFAFHSPSARATVASHYVEAEDSIRIRSASRM